MVGMSPSPVIGVLSGCGGAGASTCAALLAGLAGPPSFLLDCDPLGGGIDVLLGCEQLPGPRWGQVRVRGDSLDPEVLLRSLPRWQGAAFLAADRPDPLDAATVLAVLGAARTAGPVVVDLARNPSPIRAAVLARCDLVLLVTAAEVRGVTAGALIAPSLDPGRAMVLVRGSSRSLPHRHIAELLGLPVLDGLPYEPAATRPDGLRTRRVRRRTRDVVARVLAEARERAGRPVPPAGLDAA
jgi:secretion/DNA translocation related CpaE-like protein